MFAHELEWLIKKSTVQFKPLVASRVRDEKEDKSDV